MNNLNSMVAYFEAAFREEIKSIGQTVPLKLYEPVAYSLMIGGKRLRPALMLHAASMFSKSVDHVLSAAMAIEIFHNFTLLHDDIMDKADVRRSLPTVHKKYNDNVAILSGDAMCILAFKYFAKGNDARVHELLPLFTTTALEVCEGQQLDMDFETRDNVTVEEYLEMIRLKTAVLIASSLKIGALLGNAKQADADLLYEYGINVGLAFQLQDDWLDVYGDPDVFGKKRGGDICANKKTYLLLKALEVSDQLTLQQLNRWLLKPDFDEEQKIAAITAIYDKTGVSEATQNLMRSYHDKALTALEKVAVPSNMKNTLIAFAGEVMERIK
ncbi:MAG TPA: polyprenyl synthetase family protein [Prolixibacteraceae bacterium]|nr:polyprenyl synthetase family protein [Prolixibacteraceae bacterium]